MKTKFKIITLQRYSKVRKQIADFQAGNMDITKAIALEISLYIIKHKLQGVLIPSPSRNTRILKLTNMISKKTGLAYKNILFKKIPLSNCQLRRNHHKPFTVPQLTQIIKIKETRSIKRIILIDDVSTSGNTFRACEQILNCNSIIAIAYGNGSRKK